MLAIRTRRSYAEIAPQTSIESSIKPSMTETHAVGHGQIHIACFRSSGFRASIVKGGQCADVTKLGIPVVSEVSTDSIGAWADKRETGAHPCEKPLKGMHEQLSKDSDTEPAIGTLVSTDPANKGQQLQGDVAGGERLDRLRHSDHRGHPELPEHHGHDAGRHLPVPAAPGRQDLGLLHVDLGARRCTASSTRRDRRERSTTSTSTGEVDPALLEWAGPNRFKMSIFPILRLRDQEDQDRVFPEAGSG